MGTWIKWKILAKVSTDRSRSLRNNANFMRPFKAPYLITKIIPSSCYERSDKEGKIRRNFNRQLWKKYLREPGDNWVYYLKNAGDSSKSERNISSLISCILWYSCWEMISCIQDQKLRERLEGKYMVSHILYQCSVKRC